MVTVVATRRGRGFFLSTVVVDALDPPDATEEENRQREAMDELIRDCLETRSDRHDC